MPHDEYIPFRDRENQSVFPEQMKLGEISLKARNGIWNIFSSFYDSVNENGKEYVLRDLQKYYILELSEDIDNYPVYVYSSNSYGQSLNINGWRGEIKKLIMNNNYINVLDFIEFIISDKSIFPKNLGDMFGKFFEKSRMAYRVVDKMIVPYSSQEEHQAIEEAFGVLERTGRRSPSKHLSQAADFLSRGKYFDSVRESIHAIESIVRAETNESSFSGAVKSIQRKHNLHPAFLEALNKLYGYTSDEKGIRHPFLDGVDSAVDEADAFYIFTSSAAFMKFFIRKIEMSNDQSSG
jgi:hypothetical protein